MRKLNDVEYGIYREMVVEMNKVVSKEDFLLAVIAILQNAIGEQGNRIESLENRGSGGQHHNIPLR